MCKKNSNSSVFVFRNFIREGKRNRGDSTGDSQKADMKMGDREFQVSLCK